MQFVFKLISLHIVPQLKSEYPTTGKRHAAGTKAGNCDQISVADRQWVDEEGVEFVMVSDHAFQPSLQFH